MSPAGPNTSPLTLTRGAAAAGRSRRSARNVRRQPTFASTVLILEDEVSIRVSLARYLHARGYTVTEASNIDQALAACQSGRFEAVILDVGVPDPQGLGRTGLQILPQLCEGPSSRPHCVIVFTGYPLTQTEEVFASRHRARIVYKPESYDTLLRCLEQPQWTL